MRSIFCVPEVNVDHTGLSNTFLFFFTRHTFIQQRVRTNAMVPGSAHGISITVDVTRTSEYPPAPIRLEAKNSWGIYREGQESDPYIKSINDSIVSTNGDECESRPWTVEETLVWDRTKH